MTNISLCRSYIALPTFFFLWLGYKLFYRTTVIPINKVDLVTGIRAIEEEEKRYLEQETEKGPRTFLQRIWDSL